MAAQLLHCTAARACDAMHIALAPMNREQCPLLMCWLSALYSVQLQMYLADCVLNLPGAPAHMSCTVLARDLSAGKALHSIAAATALRYLTAVKSAAALPLIITGLF